MAGQGREKGPIDRDRSIRVPVSVAELERAHELAHIARCTLTEWIRQLMDREAERAGLLPAPKRGSKR